MTISDEAETISYGLFAHVAMASTGSQSKMPRHIRSRPAGATGSRSACAGRDPRSRGSRVGRCRGQAWQERRGSALPQRRAPSTASSSSEKGDCHHFRADAKKVAVPVFVTVDIRLDRSDICNLPLTNIILRRSSRCERRGRAAVERINRRVSVIFLTFQILTCGARVSAAEQTDSIRRAVVGTVVDASGAVVPGVGVVLKHSSGSERRARTDSAGHFIFQNVVGPRSSSQH